MKRSPVTPIRVPAGPTRVQHDAAASAGPVEHGWVGGAGSGGSPRAGFGMLSVSARFFRACVSVAASFTMAAAPMVGVGLLLGCDPECRGAACASFYTDADIHLLFGPIDTTADPVTDASGTIPGGEEDGYDWVLRAWDGGLTVGLPALGEVRVWASSAFVTAAAAGGTIRSDEPDDRFGAALGALSRDDDLLLMVGAPDASADADHVQSGAVYIFDGLAKRFSGGRLASERLLQINGHQPGMRLGALVTGCGDLTGDGLTEFVLSAPGDGTAADLAGAVYLGDVGLLDQGAISASALTLVTGPDPVEGAAFGRSVLCDRNIVDDTAGASTHLVIGAPYAGANGLAGGEVYVYGAGADLDLSDPVLTLHGESGAYFGAAMVWANLDQDAWPDLVVGAPGVDPVLPSAGEALSNMTGAVYVYRGRKLRDRLLTEVDVFLDEHPADAVLTWTWASRDEAAADGDGRFGFALSAADLDGNGSDEILVGMPGLDAAEGAQAGAIAVWRIRAAQIFYDTTAHEIAIIAGTAPFQETGARFATSDMDGDGDDDIIIQNRRRN